MKRYPVGAPVTVKIPITNFYNEAVTPTAISLRVLDEDGDIIVNIPVIGFSPGDVDVTYTVSGVNNTVDAGEALCLRVVEITIVTASGTFIQSASYMIALETQLIIPQNSFQTYNRALVMADSILKLSNWDLADRATREIAMIEAFQKITSFRYQIDDSGWQDVSHLSNFGAFAAISPQDWRYMNKDYFDSLPDHFLTALRKTQVIEANEIMNLSNPDDSRSAGIMSEKIGESSMMFRVGKPIELGMSKNSMKLMRGYIDSRVGLARA